MTSRKGAAPLVIAADRSLAVAISSVNRLPFLSSSLPPAPQIASETTSLNPASTSPCNTAAVGVSSTWSNLAVPAPTAVHNVMASPLERSSFVVGYFRQAGALLASTDLGERSP